ncbi:MAG: glycosyltransferase, partial [Candidatus Helarchaeota archaeon]
MVEFPRESSSALAVTTFMLNPRKGFQELRHGIKFEPEVSVIVCTKNEEKNIATVLSSLLAVDYPKDKYEILIVDESKDRTPEIVR